MPSIAKAHSIEKEFYYEERLGELRTLNETVTACNKTLTEENDDLRNRLQESDRKVNDLAPFKELNQNLQNEVDSLKESG